MRAVREGLLLVLLVSAPPLLASLAVGLVVGVLQAATQIQDQTLVFLLVRPVRRSTVYYARYAAGLVPGVFAAVGMTLAAILATRVPLPLTATLAALGSAALSVCTIGALYYALAALFRRGLVAGLVYTFVVEGLFQGLPGSIQKLSLSHHIRSVFHRATDADFAALSSRVRSMMEDVSPRAGGFAPLRHVPKNKGVVLGLVSSKTPTLEKLDDLRRRADEAARYIDAARLAVSPQCGFASSIGGNPVTQEDERAKLRLCVDAARAIWGNA